MKTARLPKESLRRDSVEENVWIGMTLRGFALLWCIFKMVFNEYNSKINKNDSILSESWA